MRAWDRSDAGRDEESVLWDLDERLGIEKPLRIDGPQLAAARRRSLHPSGVPTWGGTGYAACFVGGGDDGGGGGGS